MLRSSRKQTRQLVVVLVGEVLAREARRERRSVADHEMVDVARHDHVGRQLRGVSQDLWNQDTALAVERAVLAEVVDALEKLVLRAMNRGEPRQLLFQTAPDRE